jgi:hypothetical protein
MLSSQRSTSSTTLQLSGAQIFLGNLSQNVTYGKKILFTFQTNILSKQRCSFNLLAFPFKAV